MFKTISFCLLAALTLNMTAKNATTASQVTGTLKTKIEVGF
jgi:hypothetical protein